MTVTCGVCPSVHGKYTRSYLCRNRTKLYYFSSSCTLYLSKTAVLVCDSLNCRCSETEQTRKERARCKWDKGSVIKMFVIWLWRCDDSHSCVLSFLVWYLSSIRHHRWETSCTSLTGHDLQHAAGTLMMLTILFSVMEPNAHCHCQYWKCFLSLEQTVLCRSCKLRLKPCFCSNQC